MFDISGTHNPAFGPPGNLLDDRSASGDTNVSVIRTPTPPNFRLKQVMGEASTGAQFLLDNFLAPAGSGRKATLLSVQETTTSDRALYYRFAYRIDRGERGVPLQAISIVAQADQSNEFVCLTVVAPADAWQTDFATKLNKIADSFRVTM